jgi:hypothetical protein
LIAVAGTADAQTVTATTGAVNGVVTDSTMSVVPGVTVTLSGSSLMTARRATTDAVGSYRFSAVPPSDYALAFELEGFASVLRDGIDVGYRLHRLTQVQILQGPSVSQNDLQSED